MSLEETGIKTNNLDCGKLNKKMKNKLKKKNQKIFKVIDEVQAQNEEETPHNLISSKTGEKRTLESDEQSPTETRPEDGADAPVKNMPKDGVEAPAKKLRSHLGRYARVVARSDVDIHLYLNNWKNKTDWKHKKEVQSYLITHCLDPAVVGLKIFPTLLEYFQNIKGGGKEYLELVLKESDDQKIGRVGCKRRKKILKLLSVT